MIRRLLAATILTVSIFALQAEPTFALESSESKKATTRAHQLAKRNTFLNTKFPKSESAPVFHLEKARAIRAGKQA